MTFECPHCGADVPLSGAMWDEPAFDCGCVLLHGHTDCDECGASMEMDFCLDHGEPEVEVTSVIEDGDGDE